MKYRVRRMCDLDLNMLNRLKLLTNDVSRGDLTDSGQPASSILRKKLSDHVHGVNCFSNETWAVMAWDWMNLVGWCMLVCHSEHYDGMPINVPLAAAGLYVRPDRRGNGIGKNLIHEASSVARKNGMGRMLVNPWNKSSASFFRSVGFVDVSMWVPGWTHRLAVKDIER